MTKLAVCGMGLLGRPIAIRLLEAGHEVTVWNRTPERADPVVERGAARAGTPAEAAKGVEVAITVLSTPQALEQVALAPDGLAEGLSEGSFLVEMSTVGPDAVRDLAGRLPSGIELVDAPVLGSVREATEGALKVFAGGSDEAYDRLLPMFEVLGSPRHIGPLGSGAAMKLVVNSTLGPVMAAVGEALALGQALGLDRGAVLDVLEGAVVGPTIKSKRGRIESGVYAPNFRLETALKDSNLLTRAAEARGVRLRLAETVRALLAEADAAGLSRMDYSALIAHIAALPASLPEPPRDPGS
jgi:3-hydroxyisobutyrate dehydrogenase-like beta-hydroxyacid dehydrogenase